MHIISAVKVKYPGSSCRRVFCKDQTFRRSWPQVSKMLPGLC